MERKKTMLDKKKALAAQKDKNYAAKASRTQVTSTISKLDNKVKCPKNTNPMAATKVGEKERE